MRCRIRLSALLVVAVLLAVPAGAQEPGSPADFDLRGQEALRVGEYRKAGELFEQAYTSARVLGDEDAATKALFRLAVTSQLQAEVRFRSGDEPTKDPAILKRSLSFYDKVLTRNPESASTLQNMAQIYFDLGEPAKARKHFEASVNKATKTRPFYLRQYADFLLESGDASAAAEQYQRLVLLAPGDPEPHRLLVKRYLAEGKDGLDPLLDYLWKLLEAGEAIKAQDAALTALEQPAASCPDGDRESLLAVVAAGLARRSRSPKEITGSRLAERLKELTGDEVVGGGAKELLDVYQSPEDSSGRFNWWSTRGHAHRDPERGIWPRDAFQSAMRRLGRWWEQRESFALAEAWYTRAAWLSPDEPDPAAYRDLVHLYAARDDIPRLKELSREVERRLPRERYGECRREQLEKIYRYHKVLGQVWGHWATQERQDWGADDVPASAIFQLNRAIEVGKLLDERHGGSAAGGREPDHSIHLDSGLIDLLSRGLVKTGSKERSLAVRIEAAERFMAAGERETVREILAPIRPDDLKELERRRYQALMQTQDQS